MQDPPVEESPATMTRDAARALWAEHYGPLAGWVLSVVGDPGVAHAVAQEAFTLLFSRRHPPKTPRAVLYRLAARLADRACTRGAARHQEPDAEPWLGRLVEALPPVTRRCVLLLHAGFTEAEIAKMEHLRAATVTRALTVLAPPPDVTPRPPVERPAASAS